MDDIRRNAEKRASIPNTTPIGESFESERKKQKAALVRQLDELDSSRVRKISAYNETVDPQKMLRVAAYCRVSTDDIDQAISIELQMRQYKEKIQANPSYKYVGTYVDDFISGTNKVRREEFQRMLADCEKGKIDIILWTV